MPAITHKYCTLYLEQEVNLVSNHIILFNCPNLDKVHCYYVLFRPTVALPD